LAGIACNVGASQTQIVPDEIDQQQARFDLTGVAFAIDNYIDRGHLISFVRQNDSGPGSLAENEALQQNFKTTILAAATVYKVVAAGGRVQFFCVKTSSIWYIFCKAAFKVYRKLKKVVKQPTWAKRAHRPLPRFTPQETHFPAALRGPDG
jgi:hypothetical protein